METDTKTDKYQWIRSQIILFEDVLFPQKQEERT